MNPTPSETAIQEWLASLSQAESKRRESTARAIAKAPTYDERIIAALKNIARNDSKLYARDAAISALQKIAEAHFLAGNDIRTYLEKLRAGELRPVVQETPPESPAAQVSPPQLSTAPVPPPLPTTRQEPTLASETLPIVEPLAPAPLAAALPVTASAETDAPKAEPVSRDSEISAHPTIRPTELPAKPNIPFDQWLLSERNIKLALYSGGLLLLLAGLIFVGVRWAYLPGIAKLGVTLAVTLGMYGGGMLLFKRPGLRIGGTALLAIASGFLPLNFVVTHLYLTQSDGNVMWLIASLACMIAYSVTALASRHNLFTVFAMIAAYSTVTAAMTVTKWNSFGAPFGYALLTLAIFGLSYAVRSVARVSFASRILRIGAHVAAPPVFLFALVSWTLAQTRYVVSENTGWFTLAAILVLAALYLIEDWRSRLLYARWCAASGIAVFAVLACTELKLGDIQTGIALKVLAAVYLVVGYVLQRGKKLDFGLPLYALSALLALFVTAQSLAVYARTPQHLALALTADTALLWLAAYLSRRIEFAFAAAWLALAPVLIFGNLYLADSVQRAFALGAMLLVYSAIGFVIAPRSFRWTLPFLSVAALLSILVPTFLYREFALLTGAFLIIAILYAVMSLRLKLTYLLLPAFAAVNFAIVSGARLFYPFDYTLARVVALAFCAWALVLYFARRELEYLRVNGWSQPFHIGALANFALTYLITFLIAGEDLRRGGFISEPLGVTLLALVALTALTAYLYRRVELAYAAAWLLIAPTNIFARLYLQDSVRVGLVLGALMLVYAAAGFLSGRTRLRLGGAFLSAAALLSGITVGVLYPHYDVMTVMFVVSALLYAFFSVWLGWRWLTLAALVALNLAVLCGVRSALTTTPDIQHASAVGYGALAVLACAAGVEIKRRGWLSWRVPLYLAAAIDFLIALGFAGASSDALMVALLLVVAIVCFAMQWVENNALVQVKLSPALSYFGALAGLNAILYATRALSLAVEYIPLAVTLGSVLYVAGALALRRGELEKLYGKPLRLVGFGGIAVAMVGVFFVNAPLVGAFTYAFAALAFGTDGFFRRQIRLVYVSGASIVAAFWWLLRFNKLTEWQAYLIPLGILLLAIGWSEARRARMDLFRVATFAGVVVLLVPLFYQSLSNVNYAALLLLESVLLFGVGLRMRSRMYVQAAILALFGNGIAQFGPAFLQLERWIHIGTIGSILLIVGLLALFRRQALLDARRAFASEWKLWRP